MATDYKKYNIVLGEMRETLLDLLGPLTEGETCGGDKDCDCEFCRDDKEKLKDWEKDANESGEEKNDPKDSKAAQGWGDNPYNPIKDEKKKETKMESKEHWMQDAFKNAHGQLRKKLGYSAHSDTPISSEKLNKARHARSAKTRKQANLAKIAREAHKK